MSKPGVPPWFDPHDEAAAAMAWSYLAEPSDHQAQNFIDQHGIMDGLQLVVSVPPQDSQWCEYGVKSDSVAKWRSRLSAVAPDRDRRRIRLLGVQVVTRNSPQWPPQLALLGAAQPWCLWVRGDASVLRDSTVSLVGARASTHYGEQIAGEFAVELSHAGCVIISGGAYGIDGCAHRGALAARGQTVAVLAGGIDRLYPTGHEQLLHTIANNGCLVSEMPLGARPVRHRFLERNRLIAALGDATVVVEAAWRSGALSTAHHALAMGRDVGAVPGPISSAMSAGCHLLLREGATCVTSAADILELARPIGAVSGDENHGQEMVSVSQADATAGGLTASGHIKGGIGLTQSNENGSGELVPGHENSNAENIISGHNRSRNQRSGPPADCEDDVLNQRIVAAIPRRGTANLESLCQATGMASHDVLARLGRLEAIGTIMAGDSASGWRQPATPRRS